MSKQEGFDTKYEYGVNLETLQKGKKYFDKYEDTRVIKYKYCIDKDSKMKDNLDEEDFMECFICGKKLYDINEDSKYSSGSKANIVFDQKRHIVFIDNKGNEYPVCYRLSHCFRRENTKIDVNENTECDEDDLEELSFNDVLRNPSQFNDSFLIAADEAFEREIKPFLKKWTFVEINKYDILDLIEDLKKVENFIKKYCDDKNIKDRVRKRIYNIAGIKYEG